MSFYLNLIVPNLLKLIPQLRLYLDPGSGSFILQVLLASLVGVGFVFRNAFFQIFSRFRKPKSEDIDEDEDEDDEE